MHTYPLLTLIGSIGLGLASLNGAGTPTPLHPALLSSADVYRPITPGTAEAVQSGRDTTIHFTFEGRDAFLKVPRQPLPGNPWVWRAYFPTWHTEIDDSLFAKGYHIAYVNTSDMYGSPESMAIWDRFYAHMVSHYGLASRVALEGVSRGGLYVHTWAKRNPTKVACLYAEVPVCDFTTWPRQIDSTEWARLKASYRFASDDQALAYTDMPIHGLEGMAVLRIPVLHTVCNSDQIVPPARNSYVFGANYLKAGGPYGAIPMDRVFNVESMKGHHFHLDRPERVVDFIHRNSYPVKPELRSESYHHLHGTRILRSKVKAETRKELNIVFLGGSITYNPGWRNHLEAYFRSRFPDAKLTFLAAGIPSLGSVPHAFRYQTDVLDRITPDILFYEAAVNDRSNGYPVEAQQKSIEGIIRNTRLRNPEADIILMHFADPDKLGDYEAGREPAEITAHNQVADHYGVPVIDLSREIADRIVNGEFTWADDIKDLHPSPFGQEYYSQSMKALLDTLMAHTPSSSTQLDAPTRLPAPLHPACYDHASYASVETAKGTFRFDSRYVPTNGQPTRPGFTDVPMLIGEQPGQRLRFTFEGNAVGICIISGNDAGQIRYRVDRKPFQSVDLFTPWSESLHLPWYLVLDDQLKRGKHTLEIEILNDKNEKSQGNACRIVHFLVNQ